jgi:hypothetical protein
VADILIDNQSVPSTPASGKSVIWVDSTAKRLMQTDDGGTHRGGTLHKNQATAQQTGFAADTYLTGSNITIPSFGMQVGQLYQWIIGIQKTAAGTTAWAVTVRIGTNATTADTSKLVLTQTVAQAATAAGCILQVYVQVRSVSATGVIVGAASPSGGSLAFGSGIQAASSTFDNSALGGNFVGLSLNGNTSAAYTIDSCTGWLVS